ncbi:MAG TPA: serine/threonine-protein kinase [Polyangiaceae bacterium]|nr:serine/threonine-protein kinase [Polyangiaceae bacterium]
MGEQVAKGDLLAGKYRVERVLGSGGMGVVVAARHLQLDVLVALKFMTEEARQDPDLVGRFLREARAAAQLRSEHIARVSDVGTLESGAPYQVIEYLEGCDLEAVLESDGPLPIDAAVEYAIQACDGLEQAHRAGIVHRDIKPSNLFLTTGAKGRPCIKVLDFGISKFQGLGASTTSSKLRGTHARVVLGSPSYMAPEQMREARSVDRRVDIWALGATLYELVTGRLPFEAESLLELAFRIAQTEPTAPRALRAEIPPALEAIVLKCLEKDRARRFDSAQQLAAALAPFAPPAETRSAMAVSIAVGASSRPAARTLAMGGAAPVSEAASGAPAAHRGPPTGARVSWGTSQVSGQRRRSQLVVRVAVVGLIFGVGVAVVFARAQSVLRGTVLRAVSASAAASAQPAVQQAAAPATASAASATASAPHASLAQGPPPQRPPARVEAALYGDARVARSESRITTASGAAPAAGAALGSGASSRAPGAPARPATPTPTPGQPLRPAARAAAAGAARTAEPASSSTRLFEPLANPN